jgi:hypothetical protein
LFYILHRYYLIRFLNNKVLMESGKLAKLLSRGCTVVYDHVYAQRNPDFMEEVVHVLQTLNSLMHLTGGLRANAHSLRSMSKQVLELMRRNEGLEVYTVRWLLASFKAKALQPLAKYSHTAQASPEAAKVGSSGSVHTSASVAVQGNSDSVVAAKPINKQASATAAQNRQVSLQYYC